jgi:molybdate transport system substrate-binding protein
MQTRYPEIPAERGEDLHHLDLAPQADLVLFMAGNQFMVLPAIVAAFQRQYPEVRAIYYETLPPGLELQQILARGALFRGELISAAADVYSAVQEGAIQTLIQAGLLDKKDAFIYLHNRLTLMVPAGNPAAVTTVADLGRDEVRISQPDPQYEDIAVHIINMYRRAGGENLVRKIMEEKKAAGTTRFTTVHHRETPTRIKERRIDVGPVWATEAVHARAAGLAFELVEPGPDLDQRDAVNYYICRLQQGANPANAEKFLQFIRSTAARRIFKSSGFVPA